MRSIHSLMDMTGKVVMITGATGNLGQVIAETIAELNASLILIDRPNSNFESMTERLKKYFNIEVICYECDFECEKSRNTTFRSLSNDIDYLNCLINNAAFTSSSSLDGWSCTFEEQSISTMKRAFEVNLTAAFHLSKTLTPKLKKTGNASIINISSIYGKYAPDWSLYKDTNLSNPAGYAFSKAAIDQMTRWLATTIAPEVRVNSISPGGIFRNQEINFVKKYSKKTPLGRMACENDFKGAIAYLASDLSEYVTGQILEVNGGWGIK